MRFTLYNIAAENPFLRVLAKWLLSDVEKLSHATVLVPNRRSARALEAVLLEESGKPALLLPVIKPIGDIDEDLVSDSLPIEGLSDDLPKTAHLHAILSIVMQWARANPESEIAQDVAASGTQAFALAQSLQQLVNQFETEDVDVGKLQDVYDLDLAGHRHNILELLKVVTSQLPEHLKAEQRIGPSARRNLLIRLEAQRVIEHKHKGPIIAAGSTGTNPATRDLLKAIAQDPRGSVILPGLDLQLDDEAWTAITHEHPQFSLKTMLDQWGVRRQDVETLGATASSRSWLIGQALRPAAVAERWHEELRGQQEKITASLTGVECIEARDRQHEAEIIALALRHHAANSKSKAAIVTPDRDLATRVKMALGRWNLTIDDSAGEPLVHGGRASLVVLLLQAIEDRFSATALFALLYNPACHFGLEHIAQLKRVRALELVAYRGLPEAESLQGLSQRVIAQQKLMHDQHHVHPLVKNLSESDWKDAIGFAAQIEATLLPLTIDRERSLHDHIETLLITLEGLSPSEELVTPSDQLLLDILTDLKEQSQWHPVLTLSKTQHSIINALGQEALRPPFNPDSQLAIYGLAEARLVDAEFLVLGGLTEGSWPERPESGPWLNRPMRDVLKLQQPERDIGVTAHDFAQGFCHAKVMLTWCKRLNGAPSIPSRWVLRLQAVVNASGLKSEDVFAHDWAALVDHLDKPECFSPLRPPRAKPPVSVRPTTFSVTRIETLIRDSYSVYAQKILNLQPLEPVGKDINAGLRGTLIHQALQGWITALQHVPPTEHLHLLLVKGREVFEPYFDLPEVNRFWWPRFQRMAQQFIGEDAQLRGNLLGSHTEVSGFLNFAIGSVQHTLTARADRIDILQNGAIRIIDYKSGAVPSIKQVQTGFAPQLTLEALLATYGTFKGIHSNKLEDVMFIQVGGGSKGVETRSLAQQTDLQLEIAKAKQGLEKLLTEFQNPNAVYVPRHNMQNEEARSDYDLLSRRLEWQLEGTAL